MTPVVRIHTDKRAPRIHYLPEWMERRGLRQVDIVNALGVSKGNVSKWVAGTVMPEPARLIALAEILALDDVAALFLHPDDDWVMRFFKGRKREETERMKAVLEAAFPPSTKSASGEGAA